MAANVSIFPPGAVCAVVQGKHSCPITSDMISYLNLSDGFHEYFQGYCLNPPSDDGCPYGYCPNPDIAGPLVRISAYLTNLFVAIIIFYHPEELRESFWSQILTVYSLLITCGISIIQRQLTRIHAIIATATAGSPLSLYIAIYAIRSMWSDGHRLASAVGHGKIIPRIIVLTALVTWIALVIYIILPSHLSQFIQLSCEAGYGQDVIKYFFFLPIVLFTGIFTPLGQWVVTLPIQLAILAWFIAIWRRRREIWPKGEKYRFRFAKVWRTVSDNYPFVQFMSVVVIPFGYWLCIIEAGVAASNDDRWSASFGQVLAMFVTLPPMIQVVLLIPRCWRWFVDLAWVRFLTCRRKRRSMGSPISIPLVLDGAPDQGEYYPEDNKDDYLFNREDDHNKTQLYRSDL